MKLKKTSSAQLLLAYDEDYDIAQYMLGSILGQMDGVIDPGFQA